MVHIVHVSPPSWRWPLNREQARPVLQVRPVRGSQQEKEAGGCEPGRRHQQAWRTAPAADWPCGTGRLSFHQALLCIRLPVGSNPFLEGVSTCVSSRSELCCARSQPGLQRCA